MAATPFICPHIIPYKDAISIISEVEKEIKGSNAQVGKSNEELMADFLTGGSALSVDIIPPVPEGLDNDGRLQIGEEGTEPSIPRLTDKPPTIPPPRPSS